MPLFWRIILGYHLRVLSLCLVAFIAILVVGRLEQIAHLISMGASKKHVALFTLFQIPYILPIALPIASLLASYLLFQKLSENYELVALRSQGISIVRLITPLLFLAFALSALNFITTSEVATRCHLATRKIVQEFTSVNPIVLLQNKKIATLKGGYVQMDPRHNGQEAKNFLLAYTHPQCDSLSLLIAKKLRIKNQDLFAEKMTLLTTVGARDSQFDHLLIENEKLCKSRAHDFAKSLRSPQWKLANDHLKMDLLKARIESLKTQKKGSITLAKICRKNMSKCYSEIARRLSMGLAPFSFTFLGIAYGIQIGRTRSRGGLAIVVGCSCLALILFFLAKDLGHFFLLATTLFFLPHALMIILALRKLINIEKGHEISI